VAVFASCELDFRDFRSVVRCDPPAERQLRCVDHLAIDVDAMERDYQFCLVLFLPGVNVRARFSAGHSLLVVNDQVFTAQQHTRKFDSFDEFQDCGFSSWGSHAY
jgi:hypothetical protein